MKYFWMMLLSVAILFSCGQENAGDNSGDSGQQMQEATKGGAVEKAEQEVELAPNGEPAHIEVKHILVSFKGAPRMTKITRSKAEAEELANQLLARAREGEDFDALMKQYSDDPGAGTYMMANNGVEVEYQGEYARSGMVPAFGNVGFKLDVGEVDIANHDPKNSPYGWHIIKRTE